MTSNTNILKQPLRKSKVEEGIQKFKLLELTPKYGVRWYEDPNANVVDVKLESENGAIIRQRDLFSLSFSSNLGKLIRAVLGMSEDELIYEVDPNEVIGKEVLGEVIYWENSRGDIYEKVKNFKSMDNNQLSDKAIV
jgi:hypothetical protein